MNDWFRERLQHHFADLPLGQCSLALLEDLQAVHDNWAPFAWREKLALVARQHGLDTSALEPA